CPNLPIMSTLEDYSAETLSQDAQAGLTVALLAVPQCMAYALLAEMNPIYGLYAALVGVFVGGIFASSEIIITGPTAKVSLVVGSVLVAYKGLEPVQAVIVLTIMVGVIQIAISLVGAGDLASFVSHSVIRGFIVGGGLVIIGDQIIYLLDAAGGKSPYFIERAYDAGIVLWDRGSVPYPRLALGFGAIALILLLRWIHESLPSGILTIIVGGFLSAWYHFGEHGLDIVGSIPRGLPDLTLPVLGLDHVVGLFGGALALTILGSVQTVSIAKSLAQENQSDINENQELFAQGIANFFTGFLQGYPVSASFTRSFLNNNLGAKTRFSSLFCGIFIGLIVLVAAPYAYYLPIPVLAGLIIVVVADIFDFSEIKTVLTITLLDRIAFLVTFVSVLILKLDTAIYVGVAVTLLLYLKQSSNLDLREYRMNESGNLEHITEPEQRRHEKIALLDVNGEVFFGAAERLRSRVNNLLSQSEELRVIILRMKNALNIDSSSVLVLQDIARELRTRGKTLILSGVTPKIRRALLDSGTADVIDPDKILIAQTDLLESTRSALERASNHIDRVLDGDVDRIDEDPTLEHTLQQLLTTQESDHGQDPVDTERVNPN
ncbi:MAG: SulP family inorganic anion transporter, partial [bacterium]